MATPRHSKLASWTELQGVSAKRSFKRSFNEKVGGTHGVSASVLFRPPNVDALQRLAHDVAKKPLNQASCSRPRRSRPTLAGRLDMTTERDYLCVLEATQPAKSGTIYF